MLQPLFKANITTNHPTSATCLASVSTLGLDSFTSLGRQRPERPASALLELFRTNIIILEETSDMSNDYLRTNTITLVK